MVRIHPPQQLLGFLAIFDQLIPRSII